MSVREYLLEYFATGGRSAPHVFSWAVAAGKSRGTVCIQARKLGYRIHGDQFVAAPPSEVLSGYTVRAAAQQARADQGRAVFRGYHYDKQTPVEDTADAWDALITRAARVVRHRGCADVLLMKDTPAGQRIFAEVYDYLS